jgi:V8-like Glu-specific endopeptidase
MSKSRQKVTNTGRSGRWRGVTGTAAAIALVPSLLAAPAAAWADDKPKPTVSPSPEGIPADILAEMQAQAKLQPAVDAIQIAAEDPASGFAGVAYEGTGLTVYYKGALNPRMTAAVASSRKIGSIQVAPAAFSRTELAAASNKISALTTRQRSNIQAVAQAFDGSGLTVETNPEAPAKMAAALRTVGTADDIAPASEIVDAADVSVPVKYVTGEAPIKAMATSRYDDFSAWNGGGRWESWRDGAGRMACTTGFGVKNNAGERFVLTAAHCATPPDYARQGRSGTFEYMGPVYQQAVSADLAIIRANGSALIFEGGAATSTTRRVSGWGYWAANQLVCQSGVTSAEQTGNTVCGLRQMESNNITMGCCDSDGDSGYVISGLIRTLKDGGGTAVRSGDSGGPVYTISGTDAVAKGIVSLGSGNRMYFQDWADVGRLWGLSPYN